MVYKLLHEYLLKVVRAKICYFPKNRTSSTHKLPINKYIQK